MSCTSRVLHLISTVEVTLDSILNSKKMLEQYRKNQIHVYESGNAHYLHLKYSNKTSSIVLEM